MLPQHADEFFLWEIFLTAKMGDPDRAMQLIEERLEQGRWFPPQALKTEQDLAALHSRPDFLRALAVCEERLTIAQSHAKPERLTQNPSMGSAPFPLLLALHGNGRDPEAEVESWSPVTDWGWLLSLPQSSQVIGPIHFVWDDHPL